MWNFSSSVQLEIRCNVEHNKRNSIFTSSHALFCLAYKHTKNDVFDDFPTISYHFPKISQDPPKVVQRQHEHLRKFSDIVRRFEKITEDSRRLPRKIQRYFHHTPTLSTIKGSNMTSKLRHRYHHSEKLS